MDGFINVPIYNYKNEANTWEDDMQLNACSYVAEASAARIYNDTVFEKYLPIKKNMTHVFSENFNISSTQLKELPFTYFALLGDVVFAEIFENIPQ